MSTCAPLILIPARSASKRFPGKLLTPLLDKPLIRWAYEAALSSSLIEQVIVATDCTKIAEEVKNFGGEALLTPPATNGTERVAHAALALGVSDEQPILNLQADWPFIDGQVIDRVLTLLLDAPQKKGVATALVPLQTQEEMASPSLVKCVRKVNGEALYFSRRSIPFYQSTHEPSSPAGFGHVGIYGYRMGFLQELSALPPTPLQEAEDLEQLKVLEHGFPIWTCMVETPLVSIDKPEDCARARQMLCTLKFSS